MPEILVVRHAQADYPFDRLTSQGKSEAGKKKGMFVGYEVVVSSPKIRAIQTLASLGYKSPKRDSRLVEYEAKDINAPSAGDYVRLVHSEKWDELVTFGQNLLTAIVEYGLEDDVLMVSHNAVMSATYRILTGEINPFDNLTGFKVSVNNGKTENIART